MTQIAPAPRPTAAAWLVPACLLLTFFVLVPSAATAALPGTDFEGDDGNLTSDAARDWQSLVGSAELVIGTDEPSGQTDDSFKGKEDDVEPEVTFGSIPNNKSDLLRFYVAHETIDVGAGADNDFLYVAWVRANTLGTANMDFEFNQSRTLSANGRTTERTAGDMLITFAFSSGGNQVNLGLSRWTDSGPCEAANSAPCWGPIVPLTGVAEGAVNELPVTDPVAGLSLAERTFGEAMVNLTDAGVFDREQCVSFGSAYVKSRSSDSFTASLKDFIRPIDVSVSNCARITIRKDAIPDDAQDFSFSASTELEPNGFQLDDDGDEANGLASSVNLASRVDGPFSVTEAATDGWDLSDVSCSEGGIPQVDAEGRPTGTVLLDVLVGDEAECTFTNTKRGRILVDQVTVPGGDPAIFDFTLDGGPDAVSRGFKLTDAADPWDSGAVRPGIYSAAQIANAAWDLTSASCDDGSPVDAVAVAPGETVTCTFVNTKRGGIYVDVVTEPAGHAEAFDLTLGGGPSALAQMFRLADQDPPHFSGLVLPGAGYAATQTLPLGWFLRSASCDDGSSPENIDVAPGEFVTCTFVNARMARILVDKTTIPGGDAASFEFALLGGPSNPVMWFQLTHDTPVLDSGYLLPGEGYTVQETVPSSGWDLTGIDCISQNGASAVRYLGADDDPAFQPGDATARIDLAVDDVVTCSFTNTKRGTVVVVKDAIPDGPYDFDFSLTGPETLVDFALDDDGDPTNDPGRGLLPNSRSFPDLLPGTYTVAQADPGPAWDATGLVCRDAAGRSVGTTDVLGRIATFELPPGETITCIFTDTQRGTVIVEKLVLEDALPGAPYDPHQQLFEFSTSYGDALWLRHGQSSESPWLPAGSSQTITEHKPRGWEVTSSCLYPDGSTTTGGASASVTIVAGGTIRCTFANEMRLHPGSSGFWRNWRNHYDDAQFVTLLAEAFRDSTVFAGLYDPATAELRSDAIALLDAVYDFGGGGTTTDQSITRELATVLLNLTVSKSDDPEIRALQRNDDICLDCTVDLSEVPGAEQLIRDWNPDLIVGAITVRDIVAVAEATWGGDVATGDYLYPLLTEAEKSILHDLLEGLNHGTILDVDPSTFPDNPSCLRLPALPGGTALMSYSASIAVSGGLEPYTWAVVEGTLPPGLYLDPYTGELLGTLEDVGPFARTYAFTVRITDSASPPKSATRTYSITVNPLPLILTIGLPDGVMGVPYWEPLEVNGGTRPVSWATIDGALPPGLTLDSDSGVISGMPEAANPPRSTTYTFTVAVEDMNQATDSETYAVTIAPSETALCDPAPPPPTGVPTLSLQQWLGETWLSWTEVDGATGYDIVRGELDKLHLTGGDFAVATVECLARDRNSTSLGYAGNPAPGRAYWFAVRGVNCGGAGSFDSASATQAASRDAGIESSGMVCP